MVFSRYLPTWLVAVVATFVQQAANPVLSTPDPGTVILPGRDDNIVPYRLPGLGPHTLLGKPAGHCDWIHPGTPAWGRVLRELGTLLR